MKENTYDISNVNIIFYACACKALVVFFTKIFFIEAWFLDFN